ncbi:hypothetical protein ACKLNR_004004 [Fusarium oxysporum f. sp. zingiberi]
MFRATTAHIPVVLRLEPDSDCHHNTWRELRTQIRERFELINSVNHLLWSRLLPIDSQAVLRPSLNFCISNQHLATHSIP